MKNKIQKYVENLFLDCSQTKKATEVKEEMISNLNDKYDDLIKNGVTKEKAYKEVIKSIGDMEELLFTLKESRENNINLESARKKKAFLTSLAVMLYIISPIFLFISEFTGVQEEIMIIPMFCVIAIATGLLVYKNMVYIKKVKVTQASLTAFAIMLYIISPIFMFISEFAEVPEEAMIIPMFSVIAVATGLLIYKNISYNYNHNQIVEEEKKISEKSVLTPIRVLAVILEIILLIFISYVFDIYMENLFSLIIIFILIVIDRIIVTIYKIQKEKDVR